MNKLLNKTSSQTIYGAMLAIIVLTCLAAYLYVFKKPLQEFKLLKSNTKLLEARVENNTGITLKLQGLQGEIDSLKERLQGQTPPLSNSQMVAHVISRLDNISAKYEVKLLGVRPGPSGTVKYFEELPFAIEVSGSYFSLFDWLQEVEAELGPMVVKKIEMRPASGKQQQIMQLSMVSYRLH